MAHKTWRDSCAVIIAKVLLETKGQDEKAIRKALFEAYPFGERKYHPYKIWLSEIKVQRKQRVSIPPKDQLDMFK